ncbi:ParB family chromosome partitioning protein [Rhodobium orientis]|uniref:Chromosome partitioning protein ParB n=1 Tax=Rhodobium orientis TaxID=34017 RepID=A0A327K0G0_9HYPH|nr:ParB/RepB/Spo0J family partition protein [Rhodobium orientis]MBB4304277.1 ParB family chromosome partitioning protein [Rhodobium orientis]MBK5948228.1 chromosome partitioning protein ParB [Rhodobium orientis]RAI28858.1 chromosome partitioning protein ParB [Rhodobium orientis]
MSEAASKKRLGRGLAALLGDVETEDAAVERAHSQRRLPVEFLRGNPRNPRRNFNEDDLADLVASVKEKGIVQPIVVRPVDDSGRSYEIIAGERRWRAAQRAGLHDVPVVVLNVTDREALELAIIENVQRSDLNAIEEALGYERLTEEFSYSQAELAKVIGKSRSHVANTMRLLRLPEVVRTYVLDGKLTAGHARTLITRDDAEDLARQIVDGNLSVREAELMTQTVSDRPKKAARAKPEKDADTRALEKSLTDAIGLNVVIDHRGEAGGSVQIRYKTLEQLDEISARLRG